MTAPNGDNRLFVVERGGKVKLVVDDVVVATYLDIGHLLPSSPGSEQGLLGMAFHPDFADNGRLYLSYTDGGGDLVVAEITVNPSANSVAVINLTTVIEVGQPATNHNGGMILFGPDEMLYIGVGDGGGGGDPWSNGQDNTTLLGAILRLDVEADGFAGDPNRNYTNPPDNPFVGTGGADEIWVWGLRNPWRFWFDSVTGRLFIADVGQNEREEVTVLEATASGANLGWNRLEGTRCYPSGGSCSASGTVLAQEIANGQLIDGRDVLGTGLGQNAIGEPVLFVLVNSVADGRSIPRLIAGVQVQAVVTGPITSLACPAGPLSDCDNPIPAGVSVGHPDVTAGTLGTYLKDADDSYVALSNNHIFADANMADLGDLVLQPGPADGGTLANPSHILGSLKDYEPIIFCVVQPCAENLIDAATVLVSPDAVDPTTICGWRPSSDLVPPEDLVPNTTILKQCGRTSGHASAAVWMTNVTAVVETTHGDALFSGLIATYDMAEPGDSGALMVDSQHRPVALLSAGGDSITLGVPITPVLARFNATIVTTPPSLPDDVGDEMFFYRDDGLFRFYEASSIGTLGTPLLAGNNYTTGWDSITSVDLDGDGQDEMFFYRNDGLYRYYNIKPDATLSTPLLAGNNYTTGWDSITSVDLDGDGQDEMFFYRNDGLYRYYNIKPDATLSTPLLAGNNYTTGWDSITSVDLDGDGQDEMFFYRNDGLYRYYNIKPDATLSTPLLAGNNYTTGWDSITSVDLDGDGQDEMFFYRNDGLYRYYNIKPDATLSTPLLAGNNYTTGWDSITSVDLDG